MRRGIAIAIVASLGLAACGQAPAELPARAATAAASAVPPVGVDIPSPTPARVAPTPTCPGETGALPPRLNFSAATDPGNGAPTVFGGFSGDGTLLGDTWQWNGASWVRVARSGPSPRMGAAMAADGTRGVLVLYGGDDLPRRSPIDPFSHETWIWRHCGWEQVQQSGGPQLGTPVMATSGANQGVVLFGLRESAVFETWVWTADRWARATAGSGPHAVMTAQGTDPSTGRPVLFGGWNQSGDPVGEQTWEWAGGVWRQLALDTRPSQRYGASMAGDRRLGELVLAGPTADAWAFAGGSWKALATPPAVHLSGAAVDYPARGQVLFVGGWLAGTTSSDLTSRVDAYDSGGWSTPSRG